MQTTINDSTQKSEQDLLLQWQQQRVTISNHKTLTHTENENYAVAVFGEVRAYQQQVNNAIGAAEQLLIALEQNVDDFYQQIAGFFSAIVIGKKEGHCYLITDHIGSIPLYYHHNQTGLVVATSLSQMQPEQFELNPQGIFNYCYFHCIPAPITIYRDVYKVEAGHQVSFNSHGYQDSKLLYRPQYNYSTAPDAELHQQCKDQVAQAVKRHVSTDCGAFLSGGLDSSTVAGMLAGEQDKAKTFSIGFAEKAYDETEYAKITSQHFSTQHHTLVLESGALIDNFEKVAAYFDEPFGNSSAMAAYACAQFAKSHGVEQMLAGDGGDEIFAGNERYAKQKVFEHFTNSPRLVQKALSGLFCHSPLQNIPIGSKAASYIKQAQQGLPDRLESYNFLNRFPLTEMFCDSFLTGIETELPIQQKRQRYNQADSSCMIEKMLFLDWKFTLADNDLIKVSKMCEMAGVTVKYPLLEKELIDFSCTIDADKKLPKQRLRDFFKQSFADFLAPQTLTKSKHGFGLPFGAWMQQSDELMALVGKALRRLSERNIIKGEFIERAITMHQQQHSGYYGELIWILVVLELWLEAHQR
jgi:asparagine synthase (glutamine-hydrolysing)